jgi:hypothetical protein
VRAHFGGVGMLADFEFQVRQRFPDRLQQIFTVVGLVEADVVGAAKRFIDKQSAPNRIDNIVHVNEVIQRTGKKRAAGLAEDTFFQL